MALNHGVVKLKNYMVNTLIELLSAPLAGMQARNRNKFLVLISDKAKELEAQRMVLLMQHGDLLDGKLQVDEVTNQYKLKDKEAFEKDFALLTNAEFNLPCVGEQLVCFNAVFEILNNLQTPMSVATTTVYDEIMTAFENWKADESK